MSRIKELLRKNRFLFGLARFIYTQVLHAFSRIKWGALKKSQTGICLDLGSGARRGRDGWVTVDQGGADIYWDLRKGIPLADGTVDRLYSSHLLEHIPYVQLLPFLNECKRVLRKDGEFLICVPNARLYIEAYMNKKLFSERSSWFEPALVDTGSSIDQLNYIAFMGGEHNYLFDEENLVNTLLKAGYRSAQLRSFDPELDLAERDSESIYAVATK